MTVLSSYQYILWWLLYDCGWFIRLNKRLRNGLTSGLKWCFSAVWHFTADDPKCGKEGISPVAGNKGFSLRAEVVR